MNFHPPRDYPHRTVRIEDGIDMPDWVFEVRVISPEEAEKILAVPVLNRPIKRTVVSKYSSDMTDGRWRLTPETIILDRNGGALDGQHRLRAIVETGKSRPFLVVSNVDPSLINVLGIGATRRAADILKMEGHTNSAALAALAQMIYKYTTVPDTYAGWNNVGNAGPSSPALREIVEAYPDLTDFIYLGRSVAERLNALPTPATTAVFLTSRVMSIEDQEEWFDGLLTGVGLQSGSPILALRNRRGRDNPRAFVAVYLTAWLAWKEGREITRLTEPRRMPQVGLPTRHATEEETRRSSMVRAAWRTRKQENP